MKKIPLTKSGSGQRLWKKAKTLIPGGNQLLSKRAEMFLPDYWPAYYSKAKGAYVWDLDGRKFLDMCLMGVGACPLGYADPDVNKAVKDAVERSAMCTLNTPEEIELAELLCKLHPWAHMVRYARSGGESMAIAARISRAYTGRDIIAFCGYHGWADWYLATNLKDPKGLNEHLLEGLQPKGVPQGLRGSILPFRYNHIDELQKIVHENKGKIAAIIMEPVHGLEPKHGFLRDVRGIADKIGAVLVFDEITIGWKLALGGAHLKYKVTPDMAIFAKAMSNGFPMSAIIGKRTVMQAAQETFISSTFWTDRIGPAAALATIKKMKRVRLHEKLAKIGVRVRDIWQKASKKHGVPIHTAEVPVILTLGFTGKDSMAAKTLFVQTLLEHGVLGGSTFYASLAHTERDLRLYASAVDDAFGKIAHARTHGGVKKFLKGPVAHAHFARLN
jgi:glutamate-1-semialdehyde aminotransferase